MLFLCVKLMLIFSFLLLQERKCSCSPKIEPVLTRKNHKVDEVRYFSARIFLLENLPNRSNFVDYDTYSIRTWWPQCRKLWEMGPLFPTSQSLPFDFKTSTKLTHFCNGRRWLGNKGSFPLKSDKRRS